LTNIYRKLFRLIRQSILFRERSTHTYPKLKMPRFLFTGDEEEDDD